MHLLDSVVRLDVVPAHCLVQNIECLVIRMLVARLNQQVEQIDFQVVAVISFQLRDHLSELVEAEDVFALFLLAQREAPHVDPAHVHENAFFTILRNFNVSKLVVLAA